MLRLIRENLQLKLVIAFILVLLVPSIIMTTYQTNQTHVALRNIEKLRQMQLIDDSARDVETSLERARTDLLTLVQNPALRYYLTADPRTSDSLQTDLESQFRRFMLQSAPFYQHICLIGISGAELKCVQMDGDSPRLLPREQLTNRIDDPVFTGALRQTSIPGDYSTIYVSDVDYTSAPDVPAIHYTTAIQRDNGELLGVVDLKVRIGVLFDQVMLSDVHTRIHMLDHQGNCLYCLTLNDDGLSQDVDVLSPDYFGDQLTTILRCDTGSLIYNDNLVIFQRIRPTSQTLQWTLIYETPLAVILQPVNRVIRVTFLLMAGLVAVTSLVAYAITGSIIRPLRRVALAADQLREQHWDVELPPSPSADEVGVLIGSFRRMIEHIQSLVNKLEGRVTELEALRDTSLILGSSLEFERVITSFLVELEHLVPYTSASIMLDYDEMLRFVGTRRTNDQVETLQSHAELIQQTLHYQQIKATREPMRVADVHQMPSWERETAIDYSYIRSWIGVPLISRGRVIGILNVDHHEIDFYTEAHCQMALAIAHQAAAAIDNARLYQEMEQLVEQRTRELRISEARSRALIETIPDTVLRVNRDGTVLDCRIQKTHYFARSIDEVIGHDIGKLLPEDVVTLNRQKLIETLTNRTVQTYEFALKSEGGADYVFETRMVALNADQVVAIVRDVSEEQRLRAQREQFIANAAHELRTPLSVIMTKVYLLGRQPEKMGKHLAVLQDVAENMKDLLNNLLDMTRFERGIIVLNPERTQIIDLVAKVSFMLESRAQEKGIELSYTIIGDLPEIAVDQLRMTQVLTNLVVNAINYTDAGYVRVAACATSETDIEIVIEDSGQGIPPEYLPDEIFMAFNRAHRQTTNKGTGLGLAISREIVELHNGRITVESTLGKGSTFRVYLPLTLPEADKPPESDPPNRLA